MKILKIFGAVLAVHVLAFVVIFANPGCTASDAATPADQPQTVIEAPAIDAPIIPVSTAAPAYDAAINFDPNAPAIPPGRFRPTRPSPETEPRPAPAEASAEVASKGSLPDTEAAETPDDEAPVIYTVVSGDSLWSVSKRYGIGYRELAAANGLASNAGLRVGQRLTIPEATPTGTASPTAAEDDTYRHVVQSGETLSAIAMQYGVSQSEIVRANGIANSDLIRPGMSLAIPGWQDTKPTTAQKEAPPAEAPPSTQKQSPASIPVISRLPPSDEIPVIRLEGALPKSP